MQNIKLKAEARREARKRTHKYFDDIYVALGYTRRNARKQVDKALKPKPIKVPKDELAELEEMYGISW